MELGFSERLSSARGEPALACCAIFYGPYSTIYLKSTSLLAMSVVAYLHLRRDSHPAAAVKGF